MFNDDKLSINELKKFKGLNKLKEKEAEQIIESLYKLAMINMNIKNN